MDKYNTFIVDKKTGEVYSPPILGEHPVVSRIFNKLPRCREGSKSPGHFRTKGIGHLIRVIKEEESFIDDGVLYIGNEFYKIELNRDKIPFVLAAMCIMNIPLKYILPPYHQKEYSSFFVNDIYIIKTKGYELTPWEFYK